MVQVNSCPTIEQNLKNRFWRLNNLYKIIDKDGRKVAFKMKPVQIFVYSAMWFFNFILKSRQHGLTTLIAVIMVDFAVFNSNMSCGIIAHTKDAVKNIFRKKVKFIYDNMPKSIREKVPAIKNDANELVLANGSSIRVGLTLRSDTINMLHITEWGKICAKYPAKAEEIITGTLPTVHEGNFLFIETTAEGKNNPCHDMSKAAEELAAAEKMLSRLEFKFFFFPWYQNPANVTDPAMVEVPDRLEKYFNECERKLHIRLSKPQRAWYAATECKLKDKMIREHPADPEEAFRGSVDGAYYAELMAQARSDGRIRAVNCDPAMPVYTFWDLGIGDAMCIWFAQFVANEIRLIDYYENNNHGLSHYAKVLQAKKYVYAEHFAPHDIKVKEFNGLSRWELAKKLGIVFQVLPAASVIDGIELVRGIIPNCFFDSKRCDRGIDCLENYKKEFNAAMGCFDEKPLHNWSSHGSDAFRYLALAYRYKKLSGCHHNTALDKMTANLAGDEDYDPLMA